MPYKTNADLPQAVKHVLPKHAQDIYKEAYNHAHEQYQDKSKKRDHQESLESTCAKVAWAAVKKKYTKGKDGKWHEK